VRSLPLLQIPSRPQENSFQMHREFKYIFRAASAARCSRSSTA
jgi:hypothetical protein